MTTARWGRWLAAATGVAAIVATGAVRMSAATAAVPHSSGTTCTDTWTTGSDGNFEDPANWSNGVPGSSDVACITAPGTYTVVLGNDTLSLTGLVVGNSSSSPTLTMGNGGASYVHVAVSDTTTIGANSTLSFGFGGTFASTKVVNNGTFTVPQTNYTSGVTITTFTNHGDFATADNLTYTLPTSKSVFDNEGSVVVSARALNFSSPSGKTGTFKQNGLITNDGALTVADVLNVRGGTICANAVVSGAGDAGVGGTLAFDTGVSASTSCGAGVAQDQIFVPNVTGTITGTIPAAYTVSIGDGGASFANVTLQGVTNAGTLSFGFGGTLTGPLTNTGTFIVAASTYASPWSSSGLDNTGTVSIQAALNVDLADQTNFANEAAGKINVASGQTLAVSSSSGTGTVVEDGRINNNGRLAVADTLQINGGTVCGNAVYSGSGDGGVGGTLSFAATQDPGTDCSHGSPRDKVFVPNVTGTIASNIPAGWRVRIGDGGASYANVTMTGTVNRGTLNVGYGATLTDTATLVNKGTFTVPASNYTTPVDLGGLTNQGKAMFSGNTSLNLDSGQYANTGKTIVAGPAVQINAPLTNTGTLTIDGGGRLSPTAFTQTAAGTFVATQAADSEPTYLTAGAASLDGTVSVTPAPGFTPSSGDQLTLISAVINGEFTNQPAGYTLTYMPMMNPTAVIATAT